MTGGPGRRRKPAGDEQTPGTSPYEPTRQPPGEEPTRQPRHGGPGGAPPPAPPSYPRHPEAPEPGYGPAPDAGAPSGYQNPPSYRTPQDYQRPDYQQPGYPPPEPPAPPRYPYDPPPPPRASPYGGPPQAGPGWGAGPGTVGFEPVDPRAGQPAPSQPGRASRPDRGRQAPNQDVFSDESLFPGDEDDEPAATGGRAVPRQASGPPPTPDRDPQQPGGPRNAAYTEEDFAFVEESDSEDVLDWKVFAESRADLREERGRRFRFRLISVGIVVVLLLAGAGAYLWFGPRSSGGPKQQAVLVQVADSNGNDVGNLLLVTGRGPKGGQGVVLTIPSQLSVNVPGMGGQPFGGSMPKVPPADQNVLSSLLGITIDGSWQLTQITLGTFIDELGGIDLNANTTVPGPNGKTAVSPGQTSLTGGQAVLYAAYRATHEPVSAQLSRLAQVFAAMLTKLPTGASSINALLGQLGTVPDPSFPNDKLAAVLSTAQTEQAHNSITTATLPLRNDGSNDLDVAAAGPLVERLLGGVVNTKRTGASTQVLVEDATGSSLSSSEIRDAAEAKLTNAGYSFVDGGRVSNLAAHSVVEVSPSVGTSTGSTIAMALGLPSSAVRVVNTTSPIADVTLLLGEDWPSIAGIKASTGARTRPTTSSSLTP